MAVIDNNNTDKLLKALRELESMSVVVGVLSSAGGELLMIANVHEFGCNIEVTEKMRGFFRHQFGINLKRDTKVIKIPERSFIRSSYDDKSTEITANGEDLITKVIEGELSARNFYEMLGQTCVNVIRNYIINNVTSPANSSLTIANKGGKSNPLVDTGRLVNSIDYEIRGA